MGLRQRYTLVVLLFSVCCLVPSVKTNSTPKPSTEIKTTPPTTPAVAKTTPVIVQRMEVVTMQSGTPLPSSGSATPARGTPVPINTDQSIAYKTTAPLQIINTPQQLTVQNTPVPVVTTKAAVNTQPPITTQTPALAVVTTAQPVATTAQPVVTTAQPVATTVKLQPAQTTPQQQVVQTTPQQQVVATTPQQQLAATTPQQQVAATTPQQLVVTSSPPTPQQTTKPIGPTAPIKLEVTTNRPLPSTPFMTAPPASVSPGYNVMIIFCNMYNSVVPTSEPLLSEYINKMKIQIATAANFDASRISNMGVFTNPDTGQLVVTFVIAPGPNNDVLYLRVNQQTFNLTDMNSNVIFANCDRFKAIKWYSTGPCPDRPCENYGMCMVQMNGLHQCNCPNMYNGRYCTVNLWPILILPFIFLIAAALVYYCCFHRTKQAAPVECKTPPKPAFFLQTADPVVVGPKTPAPVVPPPVVAPVPAPVPVPVPVPVPAPVPAPVPLPLRPPSPAPSIPYYIQPPAPIHAPAPTCNMMPDPDIYYQAMGQRMALAFNDYTFAPGPGRPGSVLFESQEQKDHSTPNDGAGFYHALGQKLNITIDNPGC